MSGVTCCASKAERKRCCDEAKMPLMAGKQETENHAGAAVSRCGTNMFGVKFVRVVNEK